MRIYPNIYSDFSCIGGNCEATCCGGWKITLDEKTYENYINIPGDFGDFVRENIESNHLIRMTEDEACPFLNEEGLCQIYIHCGENYLSNTCTQFPRRNMNMGNIHFLGLSLSCEEVLRLLYHTESQIELCITGKAGLAKREDSFLQLLEWSIKLLQDEKIPFGIALGTVCYLGSMAFDAWKAKDYEQVRLRFTQLPSVMEEFLQAKQDLMPEELQEIALHHIFNVVDTFNQVVFKSTLPNKDSYLCEDSYFHMSDQQRKDYMIQLVEKNRGNVIKDTPVTRKVAASFLIGHLLSIVSETSEQVFTASFANYVLLSRVLPLTWSQDVQCDERQYLATMARFGRVFDQSHAMQNLIWPVIKDLFEPDVLTYAMSFMYLFPE
ncbi:MAG: flagellin lysine-N-methylase [Lachnospiraceae bacterium]|nr:flagellin lysine-N-methylase [Lachnospiraceae bacterium]